MPVLCSGFPTIDPDSEGCWLQIRQCYLPLIMGSLNSTATSKVCLPLKTLKSSRCGQLVHTCLATWPRWLKKRRKARVDRSRMIANNQEYQRQLLDTTAAYQREIEIQRLTSFLATPAHNMALNPSVIQAGRIAQNRQAKLEDAALQTSMNGARVQLNKLIMAQEEYNRPLVRLRRMDQGNIMDRRR